MSKNLAVADSDTEVEEPGEDALLDRDFAVPDCDPNDEWSSATEKSEEAESGSDAEL